jgi:hypothetical protein
LRIRALAQGDSALASDATRQACSPAIMNTLIATDTVTMGASREDVLEAMAEVMERQARVARAEAALAAARRRLGDSVARLSSLARARGDSADLPPLAVAALEADETAGPAVWGQSPRNGSGGPESHASHVGDERAGTLRERILTVIEASPEAVHTPARLAPLVGSPNRDSVRNTLLVLAAKGKIDKIGAGHYQARKKESAASAVPQPDQREV